MNEQSEAVKHYEEKRSALLARRAQLRLDTWGMQPGPEELALQGELNKVTRLVRAARNMEAERQQEDLDQQVFEHWKSREFSQMWKDAVQDGRHGGSTKGEELPQATEAEAHQG